MSKWNNINIADDIHDMYIQEEERQKRKGVKMARPLKQMVMDNKAYAGLVGVLIAATGMAIGHTIIMALGVALMGVYVIIDFTEK